MTSNKSFPIFTCCLLAILVVLIVQIDCRRYIHIHHHNRHQKKVNTVKYFYEVYTGYNNPDKVNHEFMVENYLRTDCDPNVQKLLCVGATRPVCLSNGTLFCGTEWTNTKQCSFINRQRCVSRDTGNKDENSLWFNSFPLQCISAVLFVDSIGNETWASTVNWNAALCVTHIAEPRLKKKN